MAGTEQGTNRRENGRRAVTLDEILRPAERRRDLRRVPAAIRRAFGLIWQAAPRQLAMSAALQVVGGLSLAAQLFVAKRLLERLLAAQGAAPALGNIYLDLGLFAALLLIVWMVGVARSEQQRLLAQLVERHTTRQLMDASTRVSLVHYDDPDFYDSLQRARVNANTRPVQIVDGVLGFLQSAPAVVALAIALIVIEPVVLGLLVIGAIPAVYVNRVSARLLYRHQVAHTPGDRQRMYLYQILTRKEEAHEIRAFASGEYLRARHDAIHDEKIRDLGKVARRRMLLGSIAGAATVATIASALALLIRFVSTGRLDLAAAGIVAGALVLLGGRLRGLLASISALYEGSLFLEDFTTFVDEYATAADDPRRDRATHAAVNATPAGEPQRRGQALTTAYSTVNTDRNAERTATGQAFEEIEFDRVSFTYPARSEPSLHDLTLRIRRGEVIALVGENGSGKTTVAKLLAGLYSPGAGAILWDGTDMRALDQMVVRDNVALIFQDFVRYFLTGRENVGMGDVTRIDDEPALIEAAERAGAHAFLSALPRGYDTILGPAFAGGSDISGGQWQRIALARAHFRDAPLLILDEPTAALDPRAEYQVYENVRRLARGRTVLFISHRFSSARLADRIFVLDGGRLVEEGSHEELMLRDGLYAELFALQARSYGEPIR